ncbi:MAG: hypothetical protein BGO01_13845 [Armatimonadetes bacterium 55-13]|nr:hypothetical protein [Armatimonadota bacterium]OJU64806.1 MAG: hypothetical protein BGO01_13845 [Armatimonadetes bacterium 55-13]
MARRRRKRRPLAYGPIFATLLVVNIVMGIRYSRLTSITKVRVIGAAKGDEHRIKAILARYHDIPALQINANALMTTLNSRSAVNRVDVTRNIFGRAVVSMDYRMPVAKVVGMSGAAIARDGSIFQTIDAVPSDLPSVSLPVDAQKPIMTLVGPWRSGEIGGLAAEVRKIVPDEEKTLTADENGGLCLNIGSKFAVRFGLPKRLDEKMDYLVRQLDQDPGLIASGKTLVLVNLDRPSYAQGVAKREQ